MSQFILFINKYFIIKLILLVLNYVYRINFSFYNTYIIVFYYSNSRNVGIVQFKVIATSPTESILYSNFSKRYTSTTGVVKFITNSQYYSNNELYYKLNLKNIHNEVVRIDIHSGKEGENGPVMVTLYQTSTFLPSEICCTSVDSKHERTKLFFNGTIFTQAFEFRPLAGSRNITDLVKLFDNGSAYVDVYTYNPDSLSLLNTDSEIRGQITK